MTQQEMMPAAEAFGCGGAILVAWQPQPVMRGPVVTPGRRVPGSGSRAADDVFDPCGTVGAARQWSIRSAGLPNQGRIRFVPRRNCNAAQPLPRGPRNGYLDRFGNEWVWDPVKREWDVQLSLTGSAQIGWLSPRRGWYVNVSPDGRVTH